MCLRRGSGVATGTAWTILLAAAPTSSGGLKCTFSPVLHGLGRLAKPGAKRQTQETVAGWPDLDRDFAEEPGLIISLSKRHSSQSPALDDQNARQGFSGAP